jgi:hypothetical protein
MSILRWRLLDFYFNTQVVLVWGNQDQPPYNCVRRCLRGIDDKVAETAVIGDAKSTADDRLSISKETATIRRKGKSNARRSLLALMTFGVPPANGINALQSSFIYRRKPFNGIKF